MASKGRFDNLDVQAMVAHLQNTLCGRRIANIYDGLTADSFILKLDGSGGSSTDNDKFLLLESGVRFHTIANFSAESTLPSPTASKLRKHLRGTRIEKVTQIGKDRVVLFQCGVGANRHSLILELYAKGNLILTDSEYNVLALLRSHVFLDTGITDAAQGVAVQVGQVYPVAYATNLSTSNLHNNDQNYNESTAENQSQPISATELSDWAVQCLESLSMDQIATADPATTVKVKKKKKNKALTLKMLLSRHDSKFAHLGPSLIEHCIRCADLPPNDNLLKDGDDSGSKHVLLPDQWARLLDSLQNEATRILTTMGKENKGYILYKQREEDVSSTLDVGDLNTHADKVFEEFLPILLKQHEQRPSLEFDNFSIAVAEYFDRFQVQKNLQKAFNAEKAAVDKVQKVRLDQQERLDALYEQQEVWQQEASTVQRHADDVDKALAVINSALDTGMDWQQLEQVVEVEQENQNPIALLIHKLVLEDDAMILRLPSVASTAGSADGKAIETVDVKILLKETAHGNANRLFAQYRNSKEKASKTVESAAKALKAAEESAKRHLAEAQKKSKQQVASTTTKHKPAWFEKFRWFITTDNYLVLGGRDAHQNEQLVKRYLRPGDAYLHADVFGAASCVLRAKRQRRKGGGTEVVPLSDQALREAGHFTICQSSAWSSRMVTSAWWVESHQVSKTPPAGEFLTVGAFMIRGKKNYLPPTPLEMGLGVMFRLGDDASIARHQNDRRDFALLNQDNGEDLDLNEASTRNTKYSDKSINIPDHGTLEEKEHLNSPGYLEPIGEIETPSQLDSEYSEPLDLTQPSTAFNDRQENSQQDTETVEPDAKSDIGTEKRGLSVRERKLIKKYGSLAAAEVAQEEQINATISPGKSKGEAAPMLPEDRKRGKKTKQKRIQKKYADQDEEDKELAMLALQGGEKAKKKDAKRGNAENVKTDNEAKQDDVAKETVALLSKDPRLVAARLPDDVKAALASCVTIRDGQGNELAVKWEKFDAETLEQLADLGNHDAQIAATRRLKELKETKQVDNFSASLGGIVRTIRKYGHESMLLKQVAVEETKDTSEPTEPKTSEHDGMDSDQIDAELDIVDDTAELYRLTGKPVDCDVLLSAVPVCAPYYTLSQYSFRVKLTPGTLKRGNAARQCLEIFTKGKHGAHDEIKRQIDLITRISDSDWVNTLSGEVKIVAPGATKIIKKQKAKKKQAEK